MSQPVAAAQHGISARAKYEDAIRAAPDSTLEATMRILELSRKSNLGPVVSRVLHAVADATTQLGQQAASHAASERTNMGVLLRVLEEVAALGLEAEDPLANARLRWIVDRR